MDVLAYSAFNEKKRVESEIATKTTELNTKLQDTYRNVATACHMTPEAFCWTRCIEPCLQREPHLVNYWTYIPDMPRVTGSFKVCCCPSGTDASFNCGATCVWTVPDGVCYVRFQLWGAGGGSGAGCCCGGSAFGSTGAYASAMLRTKPGCEYVICAGCAYFCRVQYSGCGRMPGCPSYVTGYGLCGFCAQGGWGRMGQWMAQWGCRGCRLLHPASSECGPCFCNCTTDYCFVSSRGVCGDIPYMPAATYNGVITNNEPGEMNFVYGIRGMWPAVTMDNSQYGTHCHPPIKGFESLTCCKICFNGTVICGANCGACAGCLCYPAAGGFFTVGYATNSMYGDMGKMGMVCVQYF
jgi:hypothetical protein